MKHTQYRKHIMLNKCAQQLVFLFSPPPPPNSLSRWELDVLGKQLLKNFTYSLIWWSNMPLEVGFLTERMLNQLIHSENLVSINHSWFFALFSLFLSKYHFKHHWHIKSDHVQFKSSLSLSFGLPHIIWPLLHNIGNKQANTYIPETHVYNTVGLHIHTSIQEELKMTSRNSNNFPMI